MSPQDFKSSDREMGKSSETWVGGEKAWSEGAASESSLSSSESDLEIKSDGSSRCEKCRAAGSGVGFLSLCMCVNIIGSKLRGG